jgi:hypothetical protein
MIELREDLTLHAEPRLDAARKRPAVHHFDGHLLLEFRVGSFGEVNLAHAAYPQAAQHAIRSDAVADHSSKALRQGVACVY